MKNLQKKIKQNNKGFSLVELLAAIGILGVVSLTIVSIMGTSSKTYTKTSTEATMQAEAQVVANSLTDRIMDCNVNIDYSPSILAATLPSVPAGNFGDATDGSVLQIVNEDARYLILLNRDDEKIYYLESIKDTTTGTYPQYDYNERQVLAEHVKDFKVNKERYEKEHIIWYELTYEKNGKEMTGTYQVNVRNHITLDQGTPNPDAEEETLQSLLVVPAVKYVNVIEGKPYESESVYANGMGSVTNGDLTKKSDVTIMTDVTYTASGKPSNADIKELEWTILPEEGTGATLEESEDTASITTRLLLDEDGDTYTQKSYRVVATANGGVQGSGTVYVRRVTGVNVSFQSGLTSSIDEETGTSMMMANRCGKVLLNAAVNGWNLGDTHRNINWQVEYRESATQDFKPLKSYNESNKIATVTTSGKTLSIVLGAKAGLSAQFRIVATSDYDRSVSGEIVFGIKGAQATDGNKVFARGVNIDLGAFFTTYGLGNWDCVNYYDATLGTMPGLSEGDLANKPAKILDGGLYLHIDDSPVNMKYYGKQRIQYFYGEITAQINVDMDYVEAGEIKRGRQDGHIYFPEVRMFKTTAELLNEIHVYNNTHKISSRNDLDWDVLNQMIALDTTANNIVVSKGNSKAIRFYLQSFNILSRETIGIYINPSSSSRGTNISSGSAGSNAYFTASLTSPLGSQTKLQDNGVVTLKALSDKASRYYPKEKIPMRICLDEYYSIDSGSGVSPDSRSYTEYNVYIANVENKNIFIPTPASDEFKSDGSAITLTTTETDYILGPAKTSVKLWKDADGATYMKYNNTTYVYNETYFYWAEI